MKPSHYTTPREMRDGLWATNADPIERPERRAMDWQDAVVITASVITLLLAVALGVL